jgi:DNA-binding MarR family transcriptional regulator
MARRQSILQSVLLNTAAIQRALATSRDHFLLGMGVNRAQLEALFLLSKQPLTIKNLAELLKITGGAATQIVNNLASEGFVERFSNNTDRRKVDIKLTPEGKIKFEKLKTAYLDRLSDILEPVSDEQLRTLVHNMEKILTQINSPVQSIKKTKS